MSARSLVAVVSAFAAFAVAATAQAAPAPSRASDDGAVVVSVTDLDLGQPAGAQAALRRIRHAADTVCGGAPHPAELDRGSLYRACMSDAVGDAVAALGAPLVTALNTGNTAAASIVTASR